MPYCDNCGTTTPDLDYVAQETGEKWCQICLGVPPELGGVPDAIPKPSRIPELDGDEVGEAVREHLATLTEAVGQTMTMVSKITTIIEGIIVARIANDGSDASMEAGGSLLAGLNQPEWKEAKKRWGIK